MEIHIIEEENPALSFLKSTYNEVVVFKESFNEGAIDKNVGSDDFWKKRYAHFESKGISKLDYFDSTIKPLTVLQNIPKNGTVYLWFSEDEKSQINRMCFNDKKRLSRNRLLEARSELRVENGE